MLTITIPGKEWYDEEKEEFVTTKEVTLTLEHSLIALSKWESKWKKPFLNSKQDKTVEESLDYVRCMTVSPQNLDSSVYQNLVYFPEIIKDINDYINDSMTATWFSNNSGERVHVVNRETITSELIYYWMISYNIPFECQKWHLERLITLIEVCNVKNTPPKKMSASDLAKRNHSLNAARRKKFNSRG